MPGSPPESRSRPRRATPASCQDWTFCGPSSWGTPRAASPSWTASAPCTPQTKPTRCPRTGSGTPGPGELRRRGRAAWPGIHRAGAWDRRGDWVGAGSKPNCRLVQHGGHTAFPVIPNPAHVTGRHGMSICALWQSTTSHSGPWQTRVRRVARGSRERRPSFPEAAAGHCMWWTDDVCQLMLCQGLGPSLPPTITTALVPDAC